MTRPSVLLLDEPTAGLSAEVARTLLTSHLPALRELNVGVMLVEQKATAALDAADWAYVMASGEVRYSGSAIGLRNHPRFSDIFFGVVDKADTPMVGDATSTAQEEAAWAT